jgi:DUF1680 family protein
MDQSTLSYLGEGRTTTAIGRAKEDDKVSGNCRFYVEKMAQRRLYRTGGGQLSGQLNELLAFVMECETRWK